MNGTATRGRTDTVRLTPIEGADTTAAIPAPWLRPPVVSVHLTTHARIRRHWASARRSPFVTRDLPVSWARACEWVGGITLGIAILSALGFVLWLTYPLGLFAHLVATGVIR